MVQLLLYSLYSQFFTRRISSLVVENLKFQKIKCVTMFRLKRAFYNLSEVCSKNKIFHNRTRAYINRAILELSRDADSTVPLILSQEFSDY